MSQYNNNMIIIKSKINKLSKCEAYNFETTKGKHR
jgi:hypothetical protein